jgi:hypothetical protein
MHLYIETMDACLVEFAADGRVRLDNEDWSTPGVQERRAIIHAANEAIEVLQEVIESSSLDIGMVRLAADGRIVEDPLAVSDHQRSAMVDAARTELESLRGLLQTLERVP